MSIGEIIYFTACAALLITGVTANWAFKMGIKWGKEIGYHTAKIEQLERHTANAPLMRLLNGEKQ